MLNPLVFVPVFWTLGRWGSGVRMMSGRRRFANLSHFREILQTVRLCLSGLYETAHMGEVGAIGCSIEAIDGVLSVLLKTCDGVVRGEAVERFLHDNLGPLQRLRSQFHTQPAGDGGDGRRRVRRLPIGGTGMVEFDRLLEEAMVISTPNFTAVRARGVAIALRARLGRAVDELAEFAADVAGAQGSCSFSWEGRVDGQGDTQSPARRSSADEDDDARVRRKCQVLGTPEKTMSRSSSQEAIRQAAAGPGATYS